MLVEVIAVLFVAGLFAVVAIPDHDMQKPETTHRALLKSLERTRTAVDRYWSDHDAAYPTFEQLAELSQAPVRVKSRGDLAAYLDRVPENPFSKSNDIAPADAPVGTSAWVYDAENGVFKANDCAENRAL